MEILPGNWYIPVVGVHTTLLLFSGLFLPRTTFLQDVTGVRVDPAQLSSLDRPQHPFLEPLTLNPLTTIIYICSGAAVLQTWWAGYIRNWWSHNNIDDSENEQRLEKTLVDRHKVQAFIDAWLTTIAGSMILHIVLILFGAPFYRHASHTYGLALLASILTIYTPAFVYGPPSLGSGTAPLLRRLLWIRLFAEFTIRSPVERAIVFPAVGSLTGTWLGAVPTALDWDRPWQTWPLTPAYGAIIGYIVGSLLSLTLNAVKQFIVEQRRLQVERKQL
ncbi:Phosphatidylinositol-glycan biosynthesis class F protein [Leucoagaricus sp. SymC.cos]|nr:Phosphatidylinositol-glycan biosynthesis class F protein [Leucoagaricus sp. SymC.cos]